MANTLSKTGITTGNTVESWHVTQSIDAFSGLEEYDITLSGSLTLKNGTEGIGKLAVSDADGKITFTSSLASLTSGPFSGSFSGSFVGDGSGLTGIISSKWTGSNPITRDGDIEVTGSINNLILGTGGGNQSGNIAIGQNSLQSNTTGNNNVALGQNSLSGNTTGNGNVALGQQACLGNGTGQHNIAIGDAALHSNIYGHYNIAIGFRSLFGDFINGATISNNISLGYNTLRYNYDNKNIAIGTKALYFNTYGTSNTAQGYKALFNNTTGQYNVAISENALYSNTTGYNNVAIGYKAMGENQTGVSNVAIGLNALYSATSGSYNTAIGSGTEISNGVSGSISLGAGAYATANGQLALGSTSHPIGPIVSEVSASSTHTLSVNVNGTIYRLLMIQ